MVKQARSCNLKVLFQEAFTNSNNLLVQSFKSKPSASFSSYFPVSEVKPIPLSFALRSSGVEDDDECLKDFHRILCGLEKRHLNRNLVGNINMFYCCK